MTASQSWTTVSSPRLSDRHLTCDSYRQPSRRSRSRPPTVIADRNMETLVLPLAPAMTADQVRAVLASVKENTQVRMASRMPPLMTEFFDRSESTFTECFGDWYRPHAVACRHRTAPRPELATYAYPELWARVHSASAQS